MQPNGVSFSHWPGQRRALSKLACLSMLILALAQSNCLKRSEASSDFLASDRTSNRVNKQLQPGIGATIENEQHLERAQIDGRLFVAGAADVSSQVQRDSTTGQSNESTSMSVYKEPSGWLVGILKEFFNDIDWQAIDNARVQIEKFIHKVDRIVGNFRSILSKAGGGGGGEPARPREGHAYASRWWGGGGDKGYASKADTTNVKQMLERVACFVGYVRLMNLSNEALAELDASKVVSNLFGTGVGQKRNSSMWSWFG